MLARSLGAAWIWRRTFTTSTLRLQVRGKAVQLLIPGDQGRLTLDLDALKRILTNQAWSELPICIVAVAGAMRTGKSFLLDNMLHHLSRQSHPGDVKHAGGASPGFPWRSGMTRHTSGIQLWSEPFILDNKAVFLMDTQGTFDHRTTMRENMTIFALSCLTSSHFIYNLMHLIREDHLQNLQLFTEYGRLAMSEYGSKPFQNLIFLVRDWHYPHEAEFGLKGGKEVLNKVLNNVEASTLEFAQLRHHMANSFETMDCCLLPYPGPQVAEDPNFSGHMADLDPRFRQHLENLMTQVLTAENLVPKQVGERVLKSREMVDYFTNYMTVFNGNNIPEPKSIFETTVQISNLHAASDVKMKYLEVTSLKEEEVLCEDDIINRHRSGMTASLDLFNRLARFGGKEARLSTIKALEHDLLHSYQEIQRLNYSRILNRYHEAKDLYTRKMSAVVWEDDQREALSEEELETLHGGAISAAFAHLQSPRGLPFSLDLNKKLQTEFKYKYLHYQSLNKVKIDDAMRKEQQRCLAEYQRTIETVLEGPFSVNPLKLEYEHADASRLLLQAFAVKNSRYGGRHVEEAQRRLEADLAAQLARFKEVNSDKRLTARLRTTVDRLSDNETYRGLWRDEKTRGYVAVATVSVITLKYIFGA